MTFELNEEQALAFDQLSDFTDSYVLKGYAGTGKTTVITRWVELMRKRPEGENARFWSAPKIVLTAPTNKAAGVLRKMAKEIKLPVDVSTIHSLLSLKMVWQKDIQVLEQDRYGDDTFGEYDYVVIDECSMLDKELMEYIRAAQESHSNKLVFMGDPCQLPPIGEPGSESFEESEEKMELVQVMRQAKDNPIQDLTLYLRTLILEAPRQYPADLLTFVDDKHILHLPVAAQEHNILDAFALAESEERDIRHVAWTNKVVDAWNDRIRDRIYGFDREEWVKGEMIVTTSPVIKGRGPEKSVVFTTDTLLTIKSEPVRTEHMNIPCWRFMCSGHWLFVPEKTSEANNAFKIEKSKRLAEAKADRRKWFRFYEFIEAFAQVKPAHSLTVHRSQGSTFDDTYVSYQNILANPNRKESLQCLYVAVTRPRSRLILV